MKRRHERPDIREMEQDYRVGDSTCIGGSRTHKESQARKHSTIAIGFLPPKMPHWDDPNTCPWALATQLEIDLWSRGEGWGCV